MKKIFLLILAILALGAAPDLMADYIRATRGIIWILKDQEVRPSDYRFACAEDLGRIIAEKSRKHGVDIDAMIALAFTESSFHMDAVGKKGEVGMYQLYARYAVEAQKYLDQYSANIEIGARRLAIAIMICTEKGKKPATWEQIYGHYRSARCDPELGKVKGRLLRKLKAALNDKRTAHNKTNPERSAP